MQFCIHIVRAARRDLKPGAKPGGLELKEVRGSLSDGINEKKKQTM